MSDQTLIPVNVVIADRSYRLRIKASDEETIRRTLKVINDKVVEFKVNFAGKDMQDYVSMVLLWYATETASGNHSAPGNDGGFLEALEKMELLVDKALEPGSGS